MDGAHLSGECRPAAVLHAAPREFQRNAGDALGPGLPRIAEDPPRDSGHERRRRHRQQRPETGERHPERETERRRPEARSQEQPDNAVQSAEPGRPEEHGRIRRLVRTQRL